MFSSFLYRSTFNIQQDERGLYRLEHCSFAKKVSNLQYVPQIEILDQEKFSEIAETIFKTDLLNTKDGIYENNYDSIALNLFKATMRTKLGSINYVVWDAQDDIIKFSAEKRVEDYILDQVFSLEIPSDKLSTDWLQLLEKHEHLLEKGVSSLTEFPSSKTGELQISTIDKGSIGTLVKMNKKNLR